MTFTCTNDYLGSCIGPYVKKLVKAYSSSDLLSRYTSVGWLLMVFVNKRLNKLHDFKLVLHLLETGGGSLKKIMSKQR